MNKVNEFGILPGSGGAGQYRGGNGVSRQFCFRKNLEISILTERRVNQPYGLEGTLSHLLHLILLSSEIILIGICFPPEPGIFE